MDYKQIIRNRSFILVIGALLLFMLTFLVIRAINKETIKIGFAADLTGKQAELGVQERNGVQLATESINAAGGIKGHKLELIIRDDKGVPENAKIADQELINAGVVAIIGHATSGQTVAGLEVTGPKKMILLSPTVSTPALSRLDDYFFRVYPSFLESSRAYARYVYQEIGIKNIAVIYDSDNSAYALTYSTTFTDEFKAMGGTITDQVSFASSKQPDFVSILEKLRKHEPEGLIMITSDVDAAFIAQQVRMMRWDLPLFTSAWAQTQTLINNGGEAVEGMNIEQAYDLSSQEPSFLDFKKRFENRFGSSPSFGAAFGYEAAMVLSNALEDGKVTGLKQALLKVKDFKGINDTFSFDSLGDVERPFYLSTIKNGKFTVVKKLTISK